MAIKMEIESEEFQEYQSPDETNKTKNEKNIKITTTTEEAIKTINISEDEDLLIPKLEPIDVDDEYDNKIKQT